ncbi:putative transmembrane anti-sigma factor [Minicystis rosea]|nr:putative transmembrane anti-sigma factor [Minicystis rosea]
MSNASRKMMDECVRFSASMAAYVDGELDPGHAVDMEAHVIGCDACAERVALIRAMRSSLKRTAAQRCPAALRARIHATLEHERHRAVVAQGTAPMSDAPPPSPKLMRLRYAVGLAAAAGVAFAMGVSRYTQVQPVAGDLSTAGATAHSEVDIDGLLDQLVALHAHPFQPDTTDPDQIQRFDPLLGVRVRRPAFQPLGGHFKGARVYPVSDRGAYLQLQYAVPQGTTADGKHITIYAFNPRVVPVRAARLEPRMVRHRPVLVGRVRGYAVAALEESGVGYAIASDFDDESTTKMIPALSQ